MKLFIIGNGFDISHNIPCEYSHFYDYLNENRYDILEIMEKFYYIDNDSELWTDFENSLEENINYDSLSVIIGENVPNFGSDDFRDRDWYDAQIYIEQECDELLENIRSGFEEWIESLYIDKVSKKYKLDRTALYITFNYTDILEQIYKIPSSNVLHIHNKVGEELIFGHGKKLENFNVRDALYGNENPFLSVDEDGNFESSQVGHEKFAEDAVCAFYDKMRKNSEDVIKKNSDFFDSLSEINDVFVLGHSYNEIDLPYFMKIAESINKMSNWNLYYFSDKDKNCAERVAKEIKIADDSQHYINCTDFMS